MNALLFLAPGWPLVLAVAAGLPGLRARALWLLPLAPLPALALVLAAWLPAGTAGALWPALDPVQAALAQAAYGPAEAPGLFLGTVLWPAPGGLVLMGMAAGLWCAAGVYALATMPRAGKAGFAAFWCVTLAGNLAVFLAADVASFYVAFAAVSLAAWGLVVHEGTAQALRAGRIYLVLAVLGEVCLLMGLLIGVAAAASLQIDAVREGLAGLGPVAGPVAAALLVTGFGIKAGLVPLHVWLPLAHPAAPVAASAVLSGAIVKAGVIGPLLLVPAVAGVGEALVVLGLTGAFAAAIYGLSQRNAKAVLAYSTVSQMGVVLALVGAALDAGAGAGAGAGSGSGAGQAAGQEAAVLYAAHHGLAKAALFLAVGAVARGRWVVLAAAILAALSVAGAPLTGGAVAKAAAKGALTDEAALALTLSGVTTALVLLRALALMAAQPAQASGIAARLGAVAPVLVLVLAAVALPWALTGAAPGLRDLRDTAALGNAAWPLALAAVVAASGAWVLRRLPPLPPGDLLALLPRGAGWLHPARWPDPTRVQAGLRACLDRLPRPPLDRAERALVLWRWSGLLLMALVLAVALGAAAGRGP